MGILGSLLGSDSGDASREAGRAQDRASRRAIEYDERKTAEAIERLEPYSDFGLDVLPLAQDRLFSDEANITQIAENMDLIQRSGLANRIMSGVRDNLYSSQAAQGKLFSGGTESELADQTINSLLPLASGINDEVNSNIWGAINTGQASAAGVANNISNSSARITDLITGGAAARAAGRVGAANARSQGITNLVGLGLTAGLLF